MSAFLRDLAVVILLWIGAAFSLLGALGVVRMPDLFTRLQSATKTCTLGVAALMLASAIHFGYLGATTRSLLVLAFVFLTAPVSAHAIVRAGYRVGVPFWGPTRIIDPRAAHPDQEEVAPLSER